MSSQITISKIKLQEIFDINGLDSFNANCERLNVNKDGDVIVDEILINYCSPWSCVLNHLY